MDVNPGSLVNPGDHDATGPPATPEKSATSSLKPSSAVVLLAASIRDQSGAKDTVAIARGHDDDHHYGLPLSDAEANRVVRRACLTACARCGVPASHAADCAADYIASDLVNGAAATRIVQNGVRNVDGYLWTAAYRRSLRPLLRLSNQWRREEESDTDPPSPALALVDYDTTQLALRTFQRLRQWAKRTDNLRRWRAFRDTVIRREFIPGKPRTTPEVSETLGLSISQTKYAIEIMRRRCAYEVVQAAVDLDLPMSRRDRIIETLREMGLQP
jgi:hypothetical protein